MRVSVRVLRKESLAVPKTITKNAPFTDRVKVLLASGAGGDGASIMSHEHTCEFAGPGGGNGGRGGNVILRSSRKFVDLEHIQSLGSQISAENGCVGLRRKSHGRGGSDLILELPIGTQVVDIDTNEVVYDLVDDAVEVLLLEGGQGGKGNAAFANRQYHSPIESTRGLPGNTLLAQLELKSIADCGLVGMPNCGKSSVISAISTCRPLIAPYPFTTLHPWVGVVNDMYGNSCRVADLPGLIEGAFENRGLGHQFLRHIERASVIAYVVDMVGSPSFSDETMIVEPWDALAALQQELEFYSPGLSERGIMVLANKMDIEKDWNGVCLGDKLAVLQSHTELPVFPVSAAECLSRHDSSGFQTALNFLCKTVFERKHLEERSRVADRKRDQLVLQRAFEAKNRGVFSRQKNALTSGVSLVDQQLEDFAGSSGFEEEFDSYEHLPARGRLTDKRDLTLRGKYWSLSRIHGEKLPAERW